MIRFKTIQNYSWDQTDSLVKIYLNIDDFKSVTKELIRTELLDKNQTVVIIVDNAKLIIKNLSHSIANEDSIKITKNFIIINLKKEENKKWSSLQKDATKNAANKGLDDFAGSKGEKEEDPSASMMKMMKSLYESGDDDMKRTIAKAWSENQNKNMNSFM